MPNKASTATTSAAIDRFNVFCLLLLILIFCAPLTAYAGISHELTVALNTDNGQIEVSDHLRFEEPRRHFQFTLNAGLQPEVEGGELRHIANSSDERHAHYLLTFQTPQPDVKLQYHGQPVFSSVRLHGGMPQGRIAPDGVYLDGASAWYPLSDEPLSRVRMSVALPAQWHSISIGSRSVANGVETWSTDRPHDDLYLIAGAFKRYARDHGDTMLSVYLLDDDPQLAERYLGSIGGYLDAYSTLIGDYPYTKFAVVENRWQTGYGMPSFTLLGSRVMRFPFILYTSLPHEILHNWWGNGVWVDYRRGNWSEGLTAYLADHWLQEQRGKGATYRLKALQRYANFAARGADRPLIEFTSRHNDASQSIGYSKAMMLFHALRMELGDDAFIAGLRRLWRESAFTRIGFEQALRTIAGDDADLQQRYVRRLHDTGAPRLVLQRADAEQVGDEWRLHIRIRQEQDAPSAIEIPVAVMLEGRSTAIEQRLPIEGRELAITLTLPARPLRLDIDPRYDMLRLLDPSEQPPALNRLFGGDNTWLVLPGDAPPALRAAWESLAAAWQRRFPQLNRSSDRELDTLPDDADLMLLGWNNKLLPALRHRFDDESQQLTTQALRIDRESSYARTEFGVVLVNNSADGHTTGFVGAPDAATVTHLARKLPHYGSYGRLLFSSDGQNLRKDALTSRHSILTRQLGNEAATLHLAERAALGDTQR
jgi:hypothetical protein